jgi:hypothetical protein
MYDPRWLLIASAAGHELVSSALPDAPVVPVAPRPRRPLRRVAQRLAASRPRLKGTRLEKEAPCGT